MRKSENIEILATAFHKAQGMVKGALKESENPFFKSKFANLESVWDACREALAANNLSIIQTAGFINEAGPTLITTLLHTSGQWIEGEQPVMAKGLTPQELGSAISYARRYGLAAIMGIIQVDDDAEGTKSNEGHRQGVPNPQSTGANSSSEKLVTEAQLKRLYAIRMKAGLTPEQVKEMAAKMGVKHAESMTREQYEKLCKQIEDPAAFFNNS